MLDGRSFDPLDIHFFTTVYLQICRLHQSLLCRAIFLNLFDPAQAVGPDGIAGHLIRNHISDIKINDGIYIFLVTNSEYLLVNISFGLTAIFSFHKLGSYLFVLIFNL